jgi:hypothetical protein
MLVIVVEVVAVQTAFSFSDSESMKAITSGITWYVVIHHNISYEVDVFPLLRY